MKIKAFAIFIAVFAVHVFVGGITWVATRQSGEDHAAGEAMTQENHERSESENSSEPKRTPVKPTESVTRPSLPRTTSSTQTSQARTKTYVVKSGDLLSVIAGRYGVTTKTLMNFNKIKDQNRIYIGQKIKIPLN